MKEREYDINDVRDYYEKGFMQGVKIVKEVIAELRLDFYMDDPEYFYIVDKIDERVERSHKEMKKRWQKKE